MRISKPFSGDRPRDLGEARTNKILRFRTEDGSLFHHTWGKTLGAARSNLFGVRRCANFKICPVAAIVRYMALSRAMHIDLTDGSADNHSGCNLSSIYFLGSDE